jgi:hypothetical protein
VQQRRQQRPITRGEPHPVRTELPLQDGELVAQHEDLRVFVPAAHRQQSLQREHVAPNLRICAVQQGRWPRLDVCAGGYLKPVEDERGTLTLDKLLSR